MELVMTPVETQINLKSVERHANVSRALVYKWHGRFRKDGLKIRIVAREDDRNMMKTLLC